MLKDFEIARLNKTLDIRDIAKNINIQDQYLECYGNDKAKVSLSIHNELANNDDGKLILVTSINPTKAGEGKTTCTIGIIDGFHKLNKKVIGCLREPSLGPVFGVKGGATGGGYAQAQPMVDINLHFTGDLHAITSCNNLISAMIDNHLYQGNELNIDPENITFKRCLDLNDRSLRNINVSVDDRVPRKDRFSITAASEIMAVLCLSNDLEDFKKRVGDIVVGYTYDKKQVTVNDLKIVGSLAALIKDAIKPNLIQTLEHTPILMHGGPFANIAHGCNSVIATKMGLKLADYVVTEAGFGADLGAEKFLNIKCRQAQIKPSAVVVVITTKSLKSHAGIAYEDLSIPNVEALKKGLINLKAHLDSLKNYNIPRVVAINRYTNDSDEELQAIKDFAKNEGVVCEMAEGFAKGGDGTVELVKKIIEVLDDKDFKYLYDDNLSIKEKIETICLKQYHAKNVEFTTEALEKLSLITDNSLQVCMAKTPMSLSDDAKSKETSGFTIHVKDIKVSSGAGFVVVSTGAIIDMPGLSKKPAALDIDVIDGEVVGIF